MILRTSYRVAARHSPQWARIEELIPPPKVGGRPCTYSRRELVNAWRYVMHSGCSWPILPNDFPHWKTVYHYVRLWRLAGLLAEIDTRLQDEAGTTEVDGGAGETLH